MKEILGYYDPILVTISFTIAAIASYTALDLAGRVTPKSSLRSRLIWIAGGAVAMGTGIWSMHFIAMLAFNLPIPVNYDVPLTLLSWAVGIAASGVALLLFSRPKLSLSVMLGGSSVMGLAIASMHYVGMAAVRVTAAVHYNPWLVALSVGVAQAASGAALWLAFRFRNSNTTEFDWWKLCSAIVMGIAISGMHYTGMWATCFMQIPDVKPVAGANSYWLGINIGIATLLILIGTLLTALFDRRYAAQLVKQSALEQSENRFRSLIEKMPVGVLLLDANGKIILCNQYVCELLKVDCDELRGQSVFKLNWQLIDESGKIISFDNNPLKQALADKQPVHNQVIGVSRDGEPETLWLLLSVDPQFAADGSVERAVCTFNNISDRKQAEDEIRLLVETTQAISRSADVESALTIILRLICTSLGWDIGEAWIPVVDGKFLKYSSTWYGRENSFEEFRRHSETVTFAFGDGLPGRVWQSQQPEWIEDISATDDRRFPRREIAVKLGLKIGFAVPVVAGAKVLAVLVFLSTKTAVDGRSLDPVCTVAAQLGSLIGRKLAEADLAKNEERFQLAIEGSSLGLWDWNFVTGKPYFDPYWKKMIGYEVDEIEHSLQCWKRLLHPDDRWRMMKALRAHIKGETPFFHLEFRMRSKSGDWKWILSHGRVTERDENGKATRMTGTHKDIGDRKLAEKKLQQQAAAIAAATDGIAILNAQGEFIYLNEAHVKIFGYDSDLELLGKSWEMLYDKAQLHRLSAEFMPDLLQQGYCSLEAEGRRRDGTTFTQDISVTLLEGGERVCIVRDISDRKRAESTLLSVTQRLQHLLSTTPAVIFSLKLGVNYELTFLSENVVSMIGYEAREILDNSIVWDSLIHPEDREIVFTALANLLSKEIVSFECRSRHKDGSYRWVYDEIRLVKDSAGLPIECVGYSVDITARKQAELALQQQLKREQLVNSIQERIRSSLNLEEVLTTAVEEMRQFLSTDRTIIYRFNPDWSGFVTVESVAESAMSILATDIHDPCFGERYARFYEQGRIRAVDNIYTAGLTPCHIDFLKQFEIKANLVVPILQGQKIWGLLIAHHCQSPRQWQSSEIESLRQISVQLAIAIQQCTLFEQAKTEIADRKLAESALQKAVAAADAANRAKSEFLASMSHELRTPLNAILGFSQVMVRDAALNSEHQQHLEIINRAGEHLLSLINDILEMSKIEAGRTKLNESSFNLYRLLKNLENMFSLKAESKGLQLTFELASGLPEFVKTDEGKLRQVLINILANAIKFTSTGGAILRARVQESRKEDNPLCLLFEIEDTGPGIDEAEMDNLFEPFGQTETGQKSKQGTGLGLPISRKFVQLMGGDITVSSTPGVGSTFAFNISIKPGDPEIQMPQNQRKVIGLAPDQPEYRILAVDDARESRLVLVKLLSSIGFQVREAGNGQEAIAVWENWQPHLILMDMQMPLVDGYEATKQIKAHPLGKNTAIVALTANAFEEDRKAILAAGCDDFVGKPFQENTLFAKMEELLGVRYVYEEPVNVKHDTKTELREVASNQSVELQLCQMPPEWVDKIYHAANACSDDQIFELIEEMPLEIASAAQVITDLANNFLFDQIIELMKSVRGVQEECKISAPKL